MWKLKQSSVLLKIIQHTCFFSVLWLFSVGFACGAKISVDHHVDSNESMVRICWKSASSSLDSLRYRRCEMEDRSSQIGDRAYWWSKIEDPRAKAQALCERKQVRAASARKELKTWHPRWAASSWSEGWGGVGAVAGQGWSAGARGRKKRGVGDTVRKWNRTFAAGVCAFKQQQKQLSRAGFKVYERRDCAQWFRIYYIILFIKILYF